MHAASIRPRAQKAAIAKGESIRYLLNSSSQEDFAAQLSSLQKNMQARGHTLDVAQFTYDNAKRNALLHRLAQRR